MEYTSNVEHNVFERESIRSFCKDKGPQKCTCIFIDIQMHFCLTTNFLFQMKSWNRSKSVKNS